MIEGEEDDSYPDDWISYDEYVEDQHLVMLEDAHLVTGPGPPKFAPLPPPAPPEFLLPPPPLPGHSNECSSISSHFDSCDISKVPISFFVPSWILDFSSPMHHTITITITTSFCQSHFSFINHQRSNII